MNESLKEQLIALGLAQEKKPGAGKTRAGKKPVRKNAGGRVPAKDISLDQAYRLRERQEQESAEAKRRQKRADDLLRRQVNGKIQAIADAHGLNDKQADIKRNFMYKGRIRSVLVTPEQLKALNAGELGVVFIRGNYVLMLPEHVDEVRKISADHVPDLGGNDPDEEEFPVPDDLVW